MKTKTPGRPKDKKPAPVKTIEVPPDVEAALSLNKVAVLLSCSRRAVERLISEGKFPQPDFRLFDRMPRWHKETFNRFYRENYRQGW